MDKKQKYWVCWKCGAVGKSTSQPLCCPAPMSARISGICAGGFREITEREYKKRLKELNKIGRNGINSNT